MSLRVVGLIGSSRLRLVVGASLRKFARFNLSRVLDLQDGKVEESVITSKFSKLRQKYEAPHYPIVLCHGFSGFDKLSLLPNWQDAAETEVKDPNAGQKIIRRSLWQLDYWYGIKEALESLGATVLTAKVPAFGSIEERATTLHKFLDAQAQELRQKSKKQVYNETTTTDHNHGDERFEGRESSETLSNPKGDLVKVNLVSHSMGGLDSRFLIHKLATDNTIKRNYKVVSLTTISTPHHGSEVADFICKVVGNNPVLRKICPPLVFEMSTSSMVKFNELVTDDPDVAYYSYGARFRPQWYKVFNLTYWIMEYQTKRNLMRRNPENLSDDIKKYLLENDGLVSVKSSHWGTYLGTLDNVDHLDLINWTNRTRNVFDKLFFAEDPLFNAIALYLDLADNLSKRGF